MKNCLNKEKIMFEFKDVVAFLCSFFKSAIQKNYTKKSTPKSVTKQKTDFCQHVIKQDKTSEKTTAVSTPQTIDKNAAFNHEETDETEKSVSEDKNVNQNTNSETLTRHPKKLMKNHSNTVAHVLT